ncbi:MAG TPA: Rab family GTPase [Gemmatimonadaceae bacterium]|nr:Rab family GTPase [Gemmatimonadaceae bacterium]
MIQKKICMVGVFGTGKTCLVQQYVHSIFAARYLSTVGVKIDRKDVNSHGQDVRLMLWDLEGRDGTRDVNASYIRGAHGIIYVADGTRPETVAELFDIRSHVVRSVGDLPSVIALNKIDLVNDWKLSSADEETVAARGLQMIRTSAKTGEGVESTFQWLADATVTNEAAPQ